MKIKKITEKNVVVFAVVNPEKIKEIVKLHPEYCCELIQAFPEKLIQISKEVPKKYVPKIAKIISNKQVIKLANCFPELIVEIAKEVPFNGFLEFIKTIPKEQAIKVARMIPSNADCVVQVFPECTLEIVKNIYSQFAQPSKSKKKKSSIDLKIDSAIPKIYILEIARSVPEYAPEIAKLIPEYAPEIVKKNLETSSRVIEAVPDVFKSFKLD